MLKRTKSGGFTLIELLVVIAVIAVLMAVIIPSLKRAKQLAERVVCANGLRQVGVAMAGYSEGFERLPDAKDSAGNQEFGHGYALYRDDWVDGNGDLIPLRWAKLYEGDYIGTPEVFYCPANRMGSYKYENYIQPGPWGYLPQNYNTQDEYGFSHNQWVRMGYTYFPIPRSRPQWDDDRLVLAQKFSELHPSVPYATDIIHSRHGLSHQRADNDDNTFKESNKYSVNALYSDTHVSNCNDPDVFEDSIWDERESEQATYDEFYLAVFKLIGSR